MSSLYLSRLNPAEYVGLKRALHESQHGTCFICERPIDLEIQINVTDIDHVVPLKMGGKDDPINFALTHQSCNRSKQASDLKVARVLARFGRIRDAALEEGRGPNLRDVLRDYGGAKHEFAFSVTDGAVKYSFAEAGDNEIRTVPLLHDPLSGSNYFFTRFPLAYLHHDDRINPRDIGGSLARLVEEFYRGRPQLHVALGWVATSSGSSPVKIFDGQHKATAQVLLGVDALPVRVFVDPDPDLLLTTNTRAGTELRQVAFDKSVQRRLGSSLFADRLERYRQDRHLPEDSEEFSERDLLQHFRGESREMKRYILDAVRAAITHHHENELRPYIEFGGKAQDLPLSYSTIEKTFLSFFIYPGVLETPLNYRSEEGLNPRDLEVEQIVKVMNVVAEEAYSGQFQPELGAARIENRVIKGEEIPDEHLRSVRMSREEILYVWLSYVKKIVQAHFNMMGQPVEESQLFQQDFPQPLWENLRNYVKNLRGLPFWVNRELASSVFGGRQNYSFWQQVFSTGKTPQGQQVLPQGINFLEMITD